MVNGISIQERVTHAQIGCSSFKLRWVERSVPRENGNSYYFIKFPNNKRTNVSEIQDAIEEEEQDHLGIVVHLQINKL